MARLVIFTFALVISLALGACGDENYDPSIVGGECAVDGHCARGAVCLRGSDYPGGMCSVTCSSSAQCPDYAACIDTEGGVCLVRCATNNDCPVGWKCKNKDREGAPGKTTVCEGD